VGTWGTTAEFRDLKVEKEGKVLFASDFDKGTEGWRTESGEWTTQEGVLRQGRGSNAFATVGDGSWTDYTLTVKARKLSGAEGFLIVFGNKTGERFWWNLGGYGNSQHGVELNQAVVGRWVPGRIETDRWYDIKVEVKGMNIRCFLDGALVHEVTARAPEKFHAVSGIDEATGDLIVKAINPGNEAFKTTVEISGAPNLGREAQLTVLTAEEMLANNSLDNPKQVVPTKSVLPNVSNMFEHTFPARSFTILRVKSR
jgi:alpha-L-arabinofuranosidase